MQGLNGGSRRAEFLGRQITAGGWNNWGDEKSEHCQSTVFNTAHLLPKDLRFSHGGAKRLAPGAI